MKPKPILLGTTLAALAAMNAPATAETYEYEDLTVTESVSYSDADFIVTGSTVVSDVDGDNTVTLSFDNSEVSLNDLTINYNNADTGISLTDSSLNVSGTTTLVAADGMNADGNVAYISCNNSSVTLADVTVTSGFLCIEDSDGDDSDSVSSLVITGTLYVGDEETTASAALNFNYTTTSNRMVDIWMDTITLADVVTDSRVVLYCDTLTLTGSVSGDGYFDVDCDQLIIVISEATYGTSDYAISAEHFLWSYTIETMVISVSEEYLAEIVAEAATEYNFQIIAESALTYFDEEIVVLDDSWNIDGYEATFANGVVTLTAVPEPGAFGILAGIAALAVVAVRRARRSRKTA